MTARKSTTPAKRPTRPARKNVDKFDELRKRAIRVGGAPEQQNSEPYVLDALEPPAVVEWPNSLLLLDDLDAATRNGDWYGVLRILLGDNYRRVLTAFDEYEDKQLLLAGLAIAIVEHFVGAGVFDAPGGSEAS